MFAKVFQGGDGAIEIFSPTGTDPFKLFKLKNAANITKEYDRTIKGYMVKLQRESSSTSMVCPKDPKQHLAITHPLLVLQLSTDSSKSFGMELTLLDSSRQRRRFYLSTNIKDVDINSLHARIPWCQPDCEHWTNVVLNMRELLATYYPHDADFSSLESLVIHPVCKLRRIFTLPLQYIRFGREGIGLSVPSKLDFPVAVKASFWVFVYDISLRVKEDAGKSNIPDKDPGEGGELKIRIVGKHMGNSRRADSSGEPKCTEENAKTGALDQSSSVVGHERSDADVPRNGVMKGLTAHCDWEYQSTPEPASIATPLPPAAPDAISDPQPMAFDDETLGDEDMSSGGYLQDVDMDAVPPVDNCLERGPNDNYEALYADSSEGSDSEPNYHQQPLQVIQAGNAQHRIKPARRRRSSMRPSELHILSPIEEADVDLHRWHSPMSSPSIRDSDTGLAAQQDILLPGGLSIKPTKELGTGNHTYGGRLSVAEVCIVETSTAAQSHRMADPQNVEVYQKSDSKDYDDDVHSTTRSRPGIGEPRGGESAESHNHSSSSSRPDTAKKVDSRDDDDDVRSTSRSRPGTGEPRGGESAESHNHSSRSTSWHAPSFLPAPPPMPAPSLTLSLSGAFARGSRGPPVEAAPSAQPHDYPPLATVCAAHTSDVSVLSRPASDGGTDVLRLRSLLVAEMEPGQNGREEQGDWGDERETGVGAEGSRRPSTGELTSLHGHHSSDSSRPQTAPHAVQESAVALPSFQNAQFAGQLQAPPDPSAARRREIAADGNDSNDGDNRNDGSNCANAVTEGIIDASGLPAPMLEYQAQLQRRWLGRVEALQQAAEADCTGVLQEEEDVQRSTLAQRARKLVLCDEMKRVLAELLLEEQRFVAHHGLDAFLADVGHFEA